MSEKVTIKVERKELHLPTIALRGLVVFPNNLVHFEVGREKSIAAVEWAMANNSNVFLVAQKEMETSEPTQQDLYTYGVVAEVKQVLRVSDELVKVLVEGKYRAKLTELDTTGDFLLSAVRSAPVRAAKPVRAKAVAVSRARPKAAPVARTPRKPLPASGEWLAGIAPGPAGARRFHLYVPPGLALRAGEKLPLLVMLHGCGQTGREVAARSALARAGMTARTGGTLWPAQRPSSRSSGAEGSVASSSRNQKRRRSPRSWA